MTWQMHYAAQQLWRASAISILNSLGIDFIHGHIRRRSCKNLTSQVAPLITKLIPSTESITPQVPTKKASLRN